jgi:capsule biosynthesis phosphatase
MKITTFLTELRIKGGTIYNIMPHHTTTVVVDYDDTLAFTYDRDWENAKPNLPLIEKLNSLYDEGWTVNIVTARGQLSCKGDPAAASKKYRDQMESWLKKHGVKYNELCFKKKLAAYYIDDKGIKPEDFLKNFERFPLKGGWSGAKVYYDNLTGFVYKTAPNSLAAVEWYTQAKEYGFSVPHIESIIGETICMESLKEYTMSYDKIVETACKFRLFKPMPWASADPLSYVDRCTKNGIAEILTAAEYATLRYHLKKAMEFTPSTFSHGDFSITNIMQRRLETFYPPTNTTHQVSELTMIDPIYAEGLYSSYVIDLAKLTASIEIMGERFDAPGVRCVVDRELRGIFGEDGVGSTILAHEAGHLSRVFKYAPHKRTIKATLKAKLDLLKCY